MSSHVKKQHRIDEPDSPNDPGLGAISSSSSATNKKANKKKGKQKSDFHQAGSAGVRVLLAPDDVVCIYIPLL